MPIQIKLFKSLAGVLALVLALGATWSSAGVLEIVAGKVAEHVAGQQVVDRIKNHISTPSGGAQLALPIGVGFTGCSQLFPNNAPIDVKKVNAEWRVVALCSNHFAVLNSTMTKTPLVVVERLNRAMLADAKGEERTNEFYADPRLPLGKRAELVDFVGSNFDRGHLANAADSPDHQSMIQSFALSNMIPQDPFNNRKGAWFKAEMDTRKYVRRAEGNVFVFSGPLFIGKQRTIGPNKVWVPSHLFKLVFDETTGKSWAHIIENSAEARLGAPVDYAEFVRQTGWQLLAKVTR